MSDQSSRQWPKIYASRHESAIFEKPAKSFLRHRLIFPLFTQRRLASVLALAAPPALTLLLHVLSPALYRAQTNIVITTSLDHQVNSSEADADKLRVPHQELINAEADLLANIVVVERTLSHLGVAELYPDFQSSRSDSQAVWDAAVRQFQSSLRVVPIQQTGMIRLTFEHPNASIAAEALNQFVLSYQESRKKVLEQRNSRVAASEILRKVNDLEQLKRARDEVLAAIGTLDVAQQREALIRQRADADARLLQTVQRVQTLSVRLADLAQTHSEVVAHNPSSQVSNRLKTPAALNEAAETPVRAALPQHRNQLAVVPDQPAGIGDRFLSGHSPTQLATRSLKLYMARDQGVPAKLATGTSVAMSEARLAQTLHDLEQDQVGSRPSLHSVRRTNLNEQPPQLGSNVDDQTKTTNLGQSSQNSDFGMVPMLTAALPGNVRAAGRRVDVDTRQPVTSEGDYDQNDILIQRLQHWLPIIQEQVSGLHVAKVKLPVTPPLFIATDQDRIGVQTELQALNKQKTVDIVSIGLIDQQLVRLEQTNLRLKMLNARISDQQERVTAAQTSYDDAKAAEGRDNASIAETIQASNGAVSVTPVMPLTLALGAAAASLLLAIAIFVISNVVAAKSLARNSSFELFLDAPRREAE